VHILVGVAKFAVELIDRFVSSDHAGPGINQFVIVYAQRDRQSN